MKGGMGIPAWGQDAWAGKGKSKGKGKPAIAGIDDAYALGQALKGKGGGKAQVMAALEQALYGGDSWGGDAWGGDAWAGDAWAGDAWGGAGGKGPAYGGKAAMGGKAAKGQKGGGDAYGSSKGLALGGKAATATIPKGKGKGGKKRPLPVEGLEGLEGLEEGAPVNSHGRTPRALMTPEEKAADNKASKERAKLAKQAKTGGVPPEGYREPGTSERRALMTPEERAADNKESKLRKKLAKQQQAEAAGIAGLAGLM